MSQEATDADEEDNFSWMFDEDKLTPVDMHSITNHLHFTSEKVVKRVYYLARIMHRALTECRITYWASGGTLLGCVRHQGLIPWDDDIDLCIYKKDISKMADLKHVLDIQDCELVPVQEFGYRVYHRTMSDKLPSEYQKHRHPFCDIFVMKRGHDTTGISSGIGRAMWPNEYYLNTNIDAMKPMPFGDIYVNCTANPKGYLERTYGDQWETHASTQNYDHVLQRYVNPVKFELTTEHLQPAKPFR